MSFIISQKRAKRLRTAYQQVGLNKILDLYAKDTNPFGNQELSDDILADAINRPDETLSDQAGDTLKFALSMATYATFRALLF